MIILYSLYISILYMYLYMAVIITIYARALVRARLQVRITTGYSCTDERITICARVHDMLRSAGSTVPYDQQYLYS